MLRMNPLSYCAFLVIIADISSNVHAQNITEKMDHYDFIVIGAGSAGLAAAKQAAVLGAKVALLNYVSPSSRGTTWGIGGTCLNVGCIPKKLFHQAALLRHAVAESQAFGWELGNKDLNSKISIQNNWNKLVEVVSNHIAASRWKINRSIRELKINYMNALGSFVNASVVKAMEVIPKEKEADGSPKFREKFIIGSHILIATGMRPKLFPDESLNKYVITSDDLFTLKRPPGKTLIIGGGYIALESAGILQELGFNTTVSARSQLLHAFDQEMVNLVREDLIKKGVKFCDQCEVVKIDLVLETPDGDQTLNVEFYDAIRDFKYFEEFNTILAAIGRTPLLENLNIDVTQVRYNIDTKKIKANQMRTSEPHVYVAGDIVSGVPEVTPLAIKSGQVLARKLFAKSKEKMEYNLIPTTLFTPLEYGFVGLSEEESFLTFGEDGLDIFHSYYYPLEWEVAKPEGAGENSRCYIKVISMKKLGRIVGMHITGPHAGDILQGFAVAMKSRVNIGHLRRSMGIHPTIAEEYTRLTITKESGLSPLQQSCCS